MEFTVSTVIKATPSQIYQAWLNSSQHSEMTGGEAIVSDKVGQTFTAWDGYITGVNLALVSDKHIIQDWRTSEFTDEEENSHIEIDLEEDGDGTRITLAHTNLPEHGMQYEQGWIDNYFEPMKTFFEK
ncbi:MAG: hypothetical protein COA58_04625 [Bacteroidetes bacterium]|nr:MAG: hypothetical protein COA58_04625 [Bacteroidota bacterium]